MNESTNSSSQSSSTVEMDLICEKWDLRGELHQLQQQEIMAAKALRRLAADPRLLGVWDDVGELAESFFGIDRARTAELLKIAEVREDLENCLNDEILPERPSDYLRLARIEGEGYRAQAWLGICRVSDFDRMPKIGDVEEEIEKMLKSIRTSENIMEAGLDMTRPVEKLNIRRVAKV